jgi:alpha-glucosidase
MGVAEVWVQKVIDLAQAQYDGYIKTHSDTLRYPRSTRADGSLGETNAADWTSGFFPGCLWYLYRFTEKDKWKGAAQKWTEGLESQKNNSRTHDLGFMLYDSYGLGYSITKEPAYKEVLLQGARSLATRFHPEVGAIRSWDNPEFHYPVIIDNLMNLEFLFWATRVSGDPSFYKMAVSHADTDLKYRFRPDNSSYHVLDFDPVSGKLLRRMTHQGYADSSCWARGQAWGIYGYTVLYRETKDKRYLERAIKTADYFIQQTDKIADHIPYWDFQAPDIPDAPKDASAAAVAASGMIELSRYAGEMYFRKAEEMLKSLCSDDYLARPGTNNYFLLKHSTGHKPHRSEIDVPIVYADYYLLEALWRYRLRDEGKGLSRAGGVSVGDKEEGMDRAQENIIADTRTQVGSPDGRIHVALYQKQAADGKKGIYYAVAFRGRPVILESALDIRMDNHILESALALKPDTAADWCADLEYKRADTASRDTTWRPLYGENATIRDHYNEATMSFAKAGRPTYTMQLVCRVYDGGVAFRYYFPENPAGVYYHITAEHTTFSLPADTKAWFTSWAQGPYRLLPVKDWPDESERPLSLQLPGGIYACLAEAQMTDYARTKFRLSKDKPNTIETSIFGAVDGITYFGTPWRTVLIGERPGDLVGNKDILLDLNPPSSLTNTEWIRPGKIIREMTLTTQGAKEAIDFAAARHLQYILFDWKWYGPAMTFHTDATKVIAPIDMAGVVDYGKQNGVGVWLYVNQQSLLRQLDTLLPLYEKWGIRGVKFGFVELGSQRWTVWLEEAIQKAAACHLMVDVHDEWRPTGEQRTWPNLLSAEGIRGNEEMPDATHNTVLPFTRYMAGPADYTICYYDPRIKTTHAHQLALAAVYYSPLLTLFWYDQPAAYHNEPEVEFFEKIPASWDESKVLGGVPGEFITVARRKGEDWFLGTITNDSARKTRISCSFLPKGRKYMATIYSDDAAVATATHVRRWQREVDPETVLDLDLLPSGGQAMWLRPVEYRLHVHSFITENKTCHYEKLSSIAGRPGKGRPDHRAPAALPAVLTSTRPGPAGPDRHRDGR